MFLLSIDITAIIHSFIEISFQSHISFTIRDDLQVEVHDIVEGYKVWVEVPSFVAVAVVIGALVMMVQNWVESVVGRFHLQEDHMGRTVPDLDIYEVFLAVVGRFAVVAKVVIAIMS